MLPAKTRIWLWSLLIGGSAVFFWFDQLKTLSEAGLMLVTCALAVADCRPEGQQGTDGGSPGSEKPARPSVIWSPVDALSAGIAHEINNPLGIIAQETQWLYDLLSRESFKGVNETRDCLESLCVIARQVDRCKEIVGKLLSLARQMHPVFQRVDINDLLEEMIVLVEKGSRTAAKVRIMKNLDSDLPLVETDPPLVRQVVLNLLDNAVHAIDEAGTVTVTTTSRDDAVEISVQDDGCGIPEENVRKIFTPFFSTKPQGRGTGLGLAMCRGIVELLGGRIFVRSDVGVGSAFTVCLPRDRSSTGEQ
ncbi:MAG: ATP-binding protein [Deltaproteobacteria bacterium]|nr:ATP-binding protein [Deltaproteobacteria bacterium]